MSENMTFELILVINRNNHRKYAKKTLNRGVAKEIPRIGVYRQADKNLALHRRCGLKVGFPIRVQTSKCNKYHRNRDEVSEYRYVCVTY